MAIGPIPTELGDLSALTELTIGGNGLTGTRIKDRNSAEECIGRHNRVVPKEVWCRPAGVRSLGPIQCPKRCNFSDYRGRLLWSSILFAFRVVA